MLRCCLMTFNKLFWTNFKKYLSAKQSALTILDPGVFLQQWHTNIYILNIIATSVITEQQPQHIIALSFYQWMGTWPKKTYRTFAASKFILQGAPNKNNLLGKIYYLSYCKIFFHQFTAFTEEDSRHIHSKFRHNICYGLKITTIWT